ncbi:MAG: type II toxin-antitoxin system Phd/YefM family antitoxin [Nitrospinae bacterium]|nr:type II toxin-antitoxin system Phd/YefM family antitoxin [Nitrospinota bacterium]
MSKILTLSEAKARLSELVATVEQTEEELVITRNGRPAAVLISAEEFESWKETREIQRNPALMQEIKQGLAQLGKGHRFSFEEVFGEPLHSTKKKK